MSPPDHDETQGQEEKVMSAVLNIAKSISRRGEGGLIIIADRDEVEGLYETHYPQITSRSLLTEQGMNVVVEKLATIDGAVIITPVGELIAFGARVLKSTTIPGFGTRHAAAAGITESLPNATAILISEESSLIKIFQKGNIVIEMDAAEINPNVMEKVVSFLTRNDMALLVATGLSLAVQVPYYDIILVGGSYLIVKAIFEVTSSVLMGKADKEKA
ncbi:DNA integrity scanning protein DisA nucleotide-binding domain protein [Methanocella conradii]|uniref:DNA integrity scanning protein DisA nucleotide-binding domain protein n=1 Tax=Methanocella conradii TaxID=1175444 RepID=UPI001ED9391D|nr:DNA integrity scanning protein DisA nucleotide-binding domain protein [Methanocella conradii]MDI6897059.1 DNA integrity scanning protein DisA nucleotide-binding domain protein [Methanocella conradii]